ncbi:MAG: hypothetical protein HUU04_05965 [Verrucomicrobiae bacterium]|nr:hypothetical protein [Verrucomicrobiae bacterium]
MELVVLETVTNAPTRVVAGDAKLAGVALTPASTFKMVIAWSAFEAGVANPSSSFRVTDAHVPGAPRALTLADAMFYSSNDAFVELVGRLPKGRLEEDLARSGFAGGPPPKDWLKRGKSEVAHGGSLRVTPRQEHAFILRLMRGELASSAAVHAQLLECLAWPSQDSRIKLYGKTGGMDGVRWFNGFGVEGKVSRAVTVLLRGDDATRADVVAAFYARFGLPPPKLP